MSARHEEAKDDKNVKESLHKFNCKNLFSEYYTMNEYMSATKKEKKAGKYSN